MLIEREQDLTNIRPGIDRKDAFPHNICVLKDTGTRDSGRNSVQVFYFAYIEKHKGRTNARLFLYERE